MFRIAWLFLLIPLFPAAPRQEAAKKTDGEYTIKKTGSLDKRISEVSGWTFINDSTLIAHNDSGNEPSIFVVNTDGTIRKTVRLEGTANVDFEDITFDGKNTLYLGDFGNNSNIRRDLAIYAISVPAILKDSVVKTSAISFSYPEQTAFPPPENQLYYDAEALAFHNKALWIITKCRTKPFDGIAKVYRIDPKTGSASLASEFSTGKGTWLNDAVTAAEYAFGQLYLVTYNRMIIVKDFDSKPSITAEIPVGGLTQKEALSVNNKGEIYITDERHPVLGGGRIFKLTKNK